MAAVMGRVILLHWNEAEARERLGRIRRAGHVARWIGAGHAAALSPLRTHPPDALVIDLGRLPRPLG